MIEDIRIPLSNVSIELQTNMARCGERWNLESVPLTEEPKHVIILHSHSLVGDALKGELFAWLEF